MVKVDIALEPDFDAVFAELRTQYSRPLRFLVACSGGADSLALTLLCADWIAKNGGAMQVLVVDHGLRSGSDLEAEQTQGWLEQKGISAIIQRIARKPSGNMLDFARRERLGLLCDAAEEFAADAILLGHHRGDQAETVLDRLARGSHVLGLCGMQPYTYYQGKLLLRPLLQLSQIRLRAYARAHHAPIIDDPSNRDRRFRRVRIRHWLWQSPELIDLALDVARHARHQAGVELAASRRLLNETISHPLHGIVCLDRTDWQSAPDVVQQRVLGSVLRYLSGRDFPPRRKQLDRVCTWLHHGGASQITLNRVRLYRQGQKIWLYGETQHKPYILASGETRQWGTHWLIRNIGRIPASVQVMGRKQWREMMPEFAKQSFLGDTCPMLNVGEKRLFPYGDGREYFQPALPAQLGSDLSKSGLYFDKLYPIS